LPDPRPRFIFPEHFVERMELPARVENALALSFAGRRLIAALCGWLSARSRGISQCTFAFEHERLAQQRPPSLLSLGFASITRNQERIDRVLFERLSRLELPAPVEALTLRAEESEPLAGRDGSLFGTSGDRSEAARSIAVLVERLQARLGHSHVFSLARVAEYRPEKASRPVAPNVLSAKKLPTATTDSATNATNPPTVAGQRPFWLLPYPQALREVDGRPQCNGPLQLLTGPERIESGWWDAAELDALGDVRRDYFIAISRLAEWLWIFRCEEGWFLHGVFA
jgi:protein ImuB